MEKVYNSLSPLSPFTWDAAAEETAEGGCSPSNANAVLHDIAELDLRFDLILDEFAVPCHHTLHRINSGAPLQRKNLTLRELQLLQYGLVVHDGTRLVMVAAPPCCGDSGACLAASYEHLFHRPLDAASAVAHHPLLPEFTFIVYRVAATVAGADPQPPARPEALFRFVYRNVNPNAGVVTGDGAAGDGEPEYKLVAVLVSSSTYYGELQRVVEYRKAWHASAAVNRAAGGDGCGMSEEAAALPLPEPVAAEVRASTSLTKLCSSLARVLERFTAASDAATLDASVVSETATSVAARDAAPLDESWQCSPPQLPASDPWSFQYTCDGARLLRRLTVVERTRALLSEWRDGGLDLTTLVVAPTLPMSRTAVSLDAHSTHPPLTTERRQVRCARLLLLPSHSERGPTQVTENEIVSHLPAEEPVAGGGAGGYGAAVVYASRAAERLRRWVLQGLVAAEVHGVHAVLLDLDPVSLLQPCVELLTEVAQGEEGECDTADTPGAAAAAAGDDTAALEQLCYKRALLLICQVVVETVERFVRHSGLVWRVTVAVREATADGALSSAEPLSLTTWCADVLALLRDAEVQRETSALHNTLSFVDDEADARNRRFSSRGNAGAVVRAGADGCEETALSASQQVALRTQDAVSHALSQYRHDATGPAAPLPPHITAKAKSVGLSLRDADMLALFRTFCTAARRRDEMLPAPALVDLLAEEWAAEGAKRRRYTAAAPRLVCPLDSCGVPVNRARVQSFLQPFVDVMRGSALRSADLLAGTKGAPVQLLNYAQFSMVMFAIAKM